MEIKGRDRFKGSRFPKLNVPTTDVYSLICRERELCGQSALLTNLLIRFHQGFLDLWLCCTSII